MPPLVDMFTPPTSPHHEDSDALPSTSHDGCADSNTYHTIVYNMDEAGSRFEACHNHQPSTDNCEALRNVSNDVQEDNIL